MNKKIIYIWLLLQSISMLSMQSEQKKMFSGSIEFPCKMNFDLCLFYKGEKLLVEKHTSMPLVEFSFLDNKETHTIYFIITNAVSCNTEIANTLHALQIPAGFEYICYKLQAKREADHDEHELLTWNISEHKLENNTLPANSLIFLFDPKLIAGLKVQSWKPENVFRIVPTLLITPQTTEAQLQRAMILARLAALDVDPLHAKTSPTKSTSAILTAMQ